ncbi:CWC16 protein, partial [Dipodascopsis uninucleata]
MAERKIINKYYPPNFDPSKIVRHKARKSDGPSKLQTVRLMAPFSMRCLTCGEYIYKGKKFNARKENTGEKYLGISVLRFYIRCTRCSSEITFKTDPKNSDYAAERGAARNFEPWREQNDAEETVEERLERLEREEQEDAMAELESKVLDSKREIAIADALDEIRTRNAVNDHIDPDSVIGKIHEEQSLSRLEELKRQDEEDLEAARRAF